MKTPEKIRLYGHNNYEEKWLIRVSDDLYKVSFPNKEELEKYIRVAFDKETTPEGEVVEKLFALDPPGGPYLTAGYRLNPFYVVKDIVGHKGQPLVQIQKNTIEHIKLKFEEPSITFNGDETRCECTVSAEGFGTYVAVGVATRKDPDTYDRHVGMSVAISQMQQDAYKWFKASLHKKEQQITQEGVLLRRSYSIANINLQHEKDYVKKF